MKEYSLGVAVTPDNVIMIQKNRPELQNGKLNFVGGKLETGETGIECMVREFFEETGVQTKKSHWKPLGTYERIDDFIVHMFYAENKIFDKVTTITDEKILKVNRQMFLHYTDLKLMSNVRTIYEFSQTSDYSQYGCQLNIVFPAVKNPTGQL